MQVLLDYNDWKKLEEKIDVIYDVLKDFVIEEKTQITESDFFFDGTAVAQMLNCSLRTLQRKRSNGEIEYSIQNGKAKYSINSLRKSMSQNVIICTEDDLQKLLSIKREQVKKAIEDQANKKYDNSIGKGNKF